MPICTRCKKQVKERVHPTTLCKACYKHAKGTKRDWGKK